MYFPKRVFLIDDDEEDRFLFGLALESFDHPIEYYSAEGGETALQLLSSETMEVPDLIFLDQHMPKLSCTEVLAGIRKMLRYAAVPIIIYSDSSLLENKETLRQLSASYFLTKPATLAELRKELQSLFLIISKAEG